MQICYSDRDNIILAYLGFSKGLIIYTYIYQTTLAAQPREE